MCEYLRFPFPSECHLLNRQNFAILTFTKVSVCILPNQMSRKKKRNKIVLDAFLIFFKMKFTCLFYHQNNGTNKLLICNHSVLFYHVDISIIFYCCSLFMIIEVVIVVGVLVRYNAHTMWDVLLYCCCYWYFLEGKIANFSFYWIHINENWRLSVAIMCDGCSRTIKRVCAFGYTTYSHRLLTLLALFHLCTFMICVYIFRHV